MEASLSIQIFSPPLTMILKAVVRAKIVGVSGSVVPDNNAGAISLLIVFVVFGTARLENREPRDHGEQNRRSYGEMSKNQSASMR
jgi:hypothetical protein